MSKMQVVPNIRLFCPYCTGKFRGSLAYEDVQRLNPIVAKNALSRRDNKTHICRLCGLAEGLADRDFAGIETEMADDMARVAIQNEMEECRRLPGYPAPLTGLNWAALYPLED